MEGNPELVVSTPDLVDPFIGRELSGKYRVTKRLGAGGMGAVYKATHLATGGDVAIKFLHGTALGDDNAIRRFQLEAQNVAALRHANTVRVIDFGIDNATLFLVMEYLEGQSLAELLARDGALPWRRTVHIVRQVLKSLWEAHEHPKRIIHRDIKPANIFVVDLPGDPDHVRVVDFGVARALDGTGADTVGLLGTPFYMAPELWRGEAVDARTDLYALGCVAYQCLAGMPPFVPPPSATESLYPLLEMHLHSAPPPLRTVRAKLPKAIVAWVDRMLAKEPNKRPASARVALEALDDAARDAADAEASKPPTPPKVEATPTSTVDVPPVARRGMALWLVALLVLGPIAIVVGLVIALSSGDAPTPIAASPTPAAPAPIATAPQPPAQPAPSHPTLGAHRSSYRTRLSKFDHLDQNGHALDDAAAIVMLDRVRLHANVGDPEDRADTSFADPSTFERLYGLVARSLDEPTRRAIIETQPLIDVTVYEGGLEIRVVPE